MEDRTAMIKSLSTAFSTGSRANPCISLFQILSLAVQFYGGTGSDTNGHEMFCDHRLVRYRAQPVELRLRLECHELPRLDAWFSGVTRWRFIGIQVRLVTVALRVECAGP